LVFPRIDVMKAIWYTEIRNIMKTLNDIKSTLIKHKTNLTDNYKVKSLGIFGSFARGEQNASSDLDVLVDFYETPGMFRFLELEEYFTNLCGLKVDLVTRKALKPNIGKNILNELVLVD
jgi:uncharacterized protein